MSSTLVGRPVPRLIAAPPPHRGSSARQIPATMSLTWMKSRDCCPSSKISGGMPFSSREAKIAATPVYGFESACPGP